jgi:tetratricopeptide (TPR) repeat protein
MILIRYFYIFIFCTFFTSSSVYSQTGHSVEHSAVVDSLTESAFSLIRENPIISLDISDKALQLSRQTGYWEGEINSLILRGMVFKQIGSYIKATESYFEALRIAEKHNQPQKISNCLNNLGNVYQTQGNYIKALDYYRNSLEIEESLGNKSQISIRLYNIGVIYESMDSLQKALTYYYNSLLIEEELQNKEGIFYALYGIAGIEIQLQMFESASHNLNRALVVAKQTNDPSMSALCYHEKGKLLTATLQYSSAILYFDSAIAEAKPLQMNYQLMELYKDKAKTLELTSNYQESCKYLTRFILLRDSINNSEIAGKVAELETRFMVEKKEKEIQFLKDLNFIKSQKANSERRNRNFLLITFFLVIILFVFNLNRIAPNIKSILLLIFAVVVAIGIITFIVFFWGNPQKAETFTSILRDVFTYSVPLMFAGLFIAERILMKKYFQKAKNYTRELQTLAVEMKNTTIDLQFEGKDATLSIALENLLCIEANDNYIKTYFLSEGKVKTELFRSTMKLVEQQLSQYEEFIRCHKSYIINTLSIDLISGNAQGYKIHLKYLDFEIPVSRNFPGELISQLKKTK